MTKMLKLCFLVILATTFEAQSFDELQKPKVGNAFSIYKDYGFFTDFMKVVPSYLLVAMFMEESAPALKDFKTRVVHSADSLSLDDYSVTYCENVDDLVAAFFNNYQIEDVRKPWKFFSEGLSEEYLARLFGIDEEYLEDGYKYVLVKLTREHMSERIIDRRNKLVMEESVESDFRDINLPRNLEGCQPSLSTIQAVYKFIQKRGSHYINSYATGDYIYQVFVYNEANFTQLRNSIGNRNVREMSDNVRVWMFSPFYTVQNGKIRSASGNTTLDDFITERSFDKVPGIEYSNIMKFSYNETDMKILSESLYDSVLLKLDLLLLPQVFSGKSERTCFTRTVDMSLKPPLEILEIDHRW